jgi:cytochrome c553
LKIPRLLLCGAILVFAFEAAAQDATLDRLLVAQCAQCHGTDSNAARGFERLTGQEYRDLRDDLADMQFEDDGDLMVHQAQGYTLSQIERIARYLSGFPEP